MKRSLAQRIAELAVKDHYEQDLPRSFGKPKEDTEWTVFAAIVAVASVRSNQESSCGGECARNDAPGNSSILWVVSSGTGTKCTGVTREDGTVLHDSHAEVLARRGLVRVLWREIQLAQSPKSQQGSEEDSTRQKRFLLLEAADASCFRLRPDIQLYMYISDSPCGDASIYSVSSPGLSSSCTPAVASDEPNNRQYTGAKLIVASSSLPSQTIDNTATHHDTATTSNSNIQHPIQTLEALDASANTVGACLVREPQNQHVGRLRSKSGRSNLHSHQRSRSMSCSDKLLRWSLLGLQGAVLTRYIQDPVRLSGVVVSGHVTCGQSPAGDASNAKAMGMEHMEPSKTHFHQATALERAINGRAKQVLEELVEQPISFSDSDWQGIQSWMNSIQNLPVVQVVSEPVFARGKTNVAALGSATKPGSHKRKRDTVLELNQAQRHRTVFKASPSGWSLNWQCSDSGSCEVTVGARGVKHGTVPRKEEDFVRLASRLSRASMARLAASVVRPQTYNTEDPSCSSHGLRQSTAWYQAAKTELASQEYRLFRQCIYQTNTLSAWMFGSNNGTAQKDEPRVE